MTTPKELARLIAEGLDEGKEWGGWADIDLEHLGSVTLDGDFNLKLVAEYVYKKLCEPYG